MTKKIFAAIFVFKKIALSYIYIYIYIYTRTHLCTSNTRFNEGSILFGGIILLTIWWSLSTKEEKNI
ncbi:MAG: hypothetical protein N7Q72_04515, partial [Spiroplasma sp. Tabriz.8]|nr:hypothetical protein [Spiroplasma sp. Tabriz.8]